MAQNSFTAWSQQRGRDLLATRELLAHARASGGSWDNTAFVQEGGRAPSGLRSGRAVSGHLWWHPVSPDRQGAGMELGTVLLPLPPQKNPSPSTG